MPAGELVEVEPAQWDPLVRRLGVTDVYYSRGFVSASAPLAGGAPTLLHAGGSDGDVLFACVVREDPVDVVTPYGYGGPLAVGASPPEFAPLYETWCAKRGALSTFVVFHPLFGNDASPAAAGFRRSPLGETVAWPLDEGDLFEAMHRHHRRVVRNARAEGLEVEIAADPSDLESFVDIYEQTMRRRDASAFYSFSEDYWRALLRDVRLVRADVRRRGELLAGVLGMGEPPWLHYHLGGTTDAGRAAGASHLALYSLAAWGQKHGFRTLHLGGGVGGRADSLQDFKRRFAPNGLVRSSVGKAVHDRDAYLRLAGDDAIDWDGFFPAYREPR
jgi:serine/alanine adding enzyme